VQPVIHCTDLAAAYGRQPVLQGVSLALHAGTVTAIIGPNGSGKSSLLKVLAGALPYSTGEVQLEQRSYSSIPARERARHVAYVPQTFAQTLPLTVDEALRIAQYPQGSKPDAAAIELALTRLGIAALRSRQCDALSGGELRKVLIAQGLVQIHSAAPAALLLDEPVAFLDPPAQHRIAQLVQLIARRDNLAVAVVAHDLELARKADAVLMLCDGRVLAQGKPAEVMTDNNIAALYAEGAAYEEIEL
jgi:iron complex transport system ATP-binding protein